MKKFKLVVFTALLFFIPLAIVLAGVEFAFRYVDTRNAAELPDFTENGTDVPLKIKSNYRGVVGGVPIVTNRYGFRDEPDFDLVPAASEHRILSMGDSIAFGLSIPSHDSYAKVLQRKFDQQEGAAHYNVINAAGPGYSPSAYYLFLKDQALQFRPSMVLIEVELTNDVTDEALMRWDVDPAAPDRPVRLRGGRYVTAWDGTLLSAYVRGPYFYEKTYTYVELSRRMLTLLYNRASAKPFPADPGVAYYTLGYEWYLLDQQRLESGWTRLFGALKATRDLLESKQIPSLLMIMPSRFVFAGSPDDPQRRFAEGLVARAVDFAKQNGISYFDFTGVIGAAGGEKVFLDTVHLNVEGNLAVGNALFDRLKAR